MPCTTGQLAQLTDAELLGDPTVVITHPDALDRAGAGAITFIRDARYAGRWPASRASAAIATRGVPLPADPSLRPVLVVADADLAMAAVLDVFAPPPAGHAPGVHPTAAIDPTAVIGPGVSIGPHASIGPSSVIGDGTVIGPGCRVGSMVRVGRSTVLHPSVTVLDRCSIGDGCLIWPGVVIGADGFGFRPSPDGRGVVKVPHIGVVEIGDGVEIGANSCVDRAKFGATVIGSGSKLDNMVQVAHNCRVGRACLICGHTALAGSVTLGDGVIVGGFVCISDQVSIGAGAKVGGGSAVMNDVPAGETWLGHPAVPYRQQARNFNAIRRLGDHIKRLDRLERTLLPNPARPRDSLPAS